MDDLVCVFSIPPGGGPTGDTLEEFPLEEGWAMDGVGYLTVPADEASPVRASAIGCEPVYRGMRTW